VYTPSSTRAWTCRFRFKAEPKRWAPAALPMLPLAADPSFYRPLRARGQQYRANVVFAGSATPRREALLQHVVEFGLALWGPGWRGTSLRDYCRGEALKTEEFVQAYGGASVAVNIHHTADGSDAREAFCNQRCFELASIGVLQVVDRRADLDHCFTPEDEVLIFDNALHLRRIVEDALQDQTAVDRIAQAGRQRMLAEHTYIHRMMTLLGLEFPEESDGSEMSDGSDGSDTSDESDRPIIGSPDR